MAQPLPEGEERRPLLLDCRGIERELGVRRATAEHVMRLCDAKVTIGRRVFVYREDVLSVVRSLEARDAA